MNYEERQAQGKFVSTILNAFQDIINAGDSYLQVLGKPYTEEPQQKKAVDESNFFLNYSEFTSSKLGKYQVAEKKGNVEERFSRALNILKVNNATISKRYHGEGYQFSYWLYGENRIYRQKRKQK